MKKKIRQEVEVSYKMVVTASSQEELKEALKTLKHLGTTCSGFSCSDGTNWHIVKPSTKKPKYVVKEK